MVAKIKQSDEGELASSGDRNASRNKKDLLLIDLEETCSRAASVPSDMEDFSSQQIEHDQTTDNGTAYISRVAGNEVLPTTSNRLNSIGGPSQDTEQDRTSDYWAPSEVDSSRDAENYVLPSLSWPEEGDRTDTKERLTGRPVEYDQSPSFDSESKSPDPKTLLSVHFPGSSVEVTPPGRKALQEKLDRKSKEAADQICGQNN